MVNAPDPTPHPPDRSGVPTEQRNHRSLRLHEMPAPEIVSLINSEDRRAVEAVHEAGAAITALLIAAEPRWLAGGRLIYLGAGTSGRLGVLDASECPPTFQTPPERVVGIIAGGDSALRRSSEGAEDDPRGAVPALQSLRLTGLDIVVGIAAGGTTPYVLGALEWAKTFGLAERAPSQRDGEGGGFQPRSGTMALTSGSPLTALITCAPISSCAFVDHPIALATGPEVVTGSTRMKAGTATKLVLNTLSTTLMIREGRVHENLMVDLRATNAKLRDRAARIVSTLTGLARTESFALLDAASGSVKAAVVMHRRGVDRAGAEQLLERARGRLDAALG